MRMKIDPAVRRETLYVAAWILLLSLLMEAVFLIAGYWNYTVLLGNVLSGAIVLLNFFLMGLTVQKAVTREEKQARNTIRLSQSLRMVILFAAAAIGVLLPVFDTVAVLVPLFFPRIAIALQPLILKDRTPRD